MEILIVCLGSRGDVNPFIGLGVFLKDHGHRVTIITSEFYESLIHSANLNFIPCHSLSEFDEVMNHPRLYDPRQGFGVVAKYMMLAPMKRVYQIISQFDVDKTLVIASQFMLGARLANEKKGYQLTTICLQPASFWSELQPAINPTTQFLRKMPIFLRRSMLKIIERGVIDKILSPQLNQFRKELELPAISNIYSKWMFSPQKIIGLFPDWFAKPAPDWPAQTKLTGFIQYDENLDLQLSNPIEDFIQKNGRPIIITYGTATQHAEHFFKVFIEAARKLQIPVIVLTAYSQQLPQLNPNRELQVEYASLKELLPKSLALIHHGGIGTIAQCLAAATPQLIVPFANDQFDNAFRVENLQVGVTLISKKQYSVDQAIEKIKMLINSKEIQKNCKHYSQKVDFTESARKTGFMIGSKI